MAEQTSLKAACPKCNNSFDILVPSDSESSGMTCACDHCGTVKKVSTFRKHHAWLLDTPRREAEAARKQAAVEKRAEDKRLQEVARRDAETNRQRLADAVAQAQPAQPPAVATVKKETPSVGVTVFVAIMLAGFVYLASGPLTDFVTGDLFSSSSSARNASRAIRCGGGDCSVFVTESAFDKCTDLAVVGNTQEIDKMLSMGQIFQIPDGTGCRIVERGLFKTKITLDDGRVGWVASEYCEE